MSQRGAENLHDIQMFQFVDSCSICRENCAIICYSAQNADACFTCQQLETILLSRTVQSARHVRGWADKCSGYSIPAVLLVPSRALRQTSGLMSLVSPAVAPLWGAIQRIEALVRAEGTGVPTSALFNRCADVR